MHEAKILSVNLVSWNHQAYLAGFFDSLDTQDLADFTVTVVDNASNDGTVRLLQDSRPSVTVLRNFRNQGASRARNQAIALALSRWPEETWGSRYILFARPDIEFGSSCLRLLVEAMEADPSLSCCGPKLLRAQFRAGADDERRETERTTLIESCGLSLTRSRGTSERGNGEEDRGQFDGTLDVFGFSGACVLFRASALAQSKVGDEWFDEEFFEELEDVDVAWRLRRLGCASRLVPAAVAWRHHASTTRKGKHGKRPRSPFQAYLTTRNRYWLIWKNDEFLNRCFHLPWILPIGIVRSVMMLVSFPRFKAAWVALIGWSKMRKKRAALAERVTVKAAEMRRWFV